VFDVTPGFVDAADASWSGVIAGVGAVVNHFQVGQVLQLGELPGRRRRGWRQLQLWPDRDVRLAERRLDHQHDRSRPLRRQLQYRDRLGPPWGVVDDDPLRGTRATVLPFDRDALWRWW
jgi:hypothetical protein